ncbi:hypothetical protein DVH24_003322 [Malus domestica]|uniref:RNase III domain-containing protein n=1 Tax=Malus domestica TaxID=3750 RepID=A0A498IKZ3_MALDO|nr:hypothetical protein DVH24_003322 [Malus domestica]
MICIVDRTVQPSPEIQQSVAAVEQIVGYNFRNKRLLEEALTHSSYSESPSYQRLEFIGDAALSLALSNYFFLAYPGVDPGTLSLLRSANVSTEKLARVAVRHGLYRHLRHNAPALRDKVREFTEAVTREDETPLVYRGSVRAPKVLADMVESVAAAMRLLEPIVTLEEVKSQPQPVTVLFELCQKHGKHVDIKHWRDETKSIASVYVDGVFVASGSSEQKEIAKLDAAKIALFKLSKSLGVSGRSMEFIAGNDGKFQIEEAKQKLHELCDKKKWPKPIYTIEKDEGPSHEKRFVSLVKISTADGVLCMVGDERSRIKDADNSAASSMICALQESGYI